jgi:hypothetical protein
MSTGKQYSMLTSLRRTVLTYCQALSLIKRSLYSGVSRFDLTVSNDVIRSTLSKFLVLLVLLTY